MNLHSFLSNLIAIHGSALNFLAYSSSSCTALFSRYWYSDAVALHSIASFRVWFPAMMSGTGYLIAPLPATLHAVHSFVPQNMWIISRSAFIPLLLWLMFLLMFSIVIYFSFCCFIIVLRFCQKAFFFLVCSKRF